MKVKIVQRNQRSCYRSSAPKMLRSSFQEDSSMSSPQTPGFRNCGQVNVMRQSTPWPTYSMALKETGRKNEQRYRRQATRRGCERCMLLPGRGTPATHIGLMTRGALNVSRTTNYQEKAGRDDQPHGPCWKAEYIVKTRTISSVVSQCA